jgi:hypothetical protein
VFPHDVAGCRSLSAHSGQGVSRQNPSLQALPAGTPSPPVALAQVASPNVSVCRARVQQDALDMAVTGSPGSQVTAVVV